MPALGLQLGLPRSHGSGFNQLNVDGLIAAYDASVDSSVLTSLSPDVPAGDADTVVQQDELLSGIINMVQPTALNQPPLDIDGGPDGTPCVTYDAVNHHMTIPDGLVKTGVDFTIAMWIYRPEGSSAFRPVLDGVHLTSGDSDGFYIWSRQAGGYFALQDPVSGSVACSTGNVPDDEWHHVAWMHDATAHESTSYLDGVAINTKGQTFTTAARDAVLVNLGYWGVFNGLRTGFRLKALTFVERQLPVGEINKVMNATKK